MMMRLLGLNSFCVKAEAGCSEHKAQSSQALRGDSVLWAWFLTLGLPGLFPRPQHFLPPFPSPKAADSL